MNNHKTHLEKQQIYNRYHIAFQNLKGIVDRVYVSDRCQPVWWFTSFLVEQKIELQKYDIDDTNIIGWPFIKDLGGMTFWDINKDMTISKEDSHPNAKGHELIARYFYENTKCKSKG